MKLLFNVEYRILWVVLWGLAIWAISGCAVIDVEGAVANESLPQIIFVTPTATARQGVGSAKPSSPATATPRPYFAEANEMGKLLVLEYHRIAWPDSRYQRSPQKFRADLQRLYDNGYYPINFMELIAGLPNVPPGKKPIALTFDDSDISQFAILDDNSIDPDGAVGIILNFQAQHPADWPSRATFFVLADDRNNYYSVFGQPKLAKAKLQKLVELGMEVGSHTVSHADLSVATSERLQWELAVSQHVIEEMVPNYKVQSLSLPYGGFPYTLDFLKAGQWHDFSYSYAGAVAAWGVKVVSPFDPKFEPYKVPRLEVTDDSINHWLTYYQEHANEYYISDGDPKRLTYPQ